MAYQKHYNKYRERGFRTFCAMKYRVTTLNGQAKTLRSQVFEIVSGVAKPCYGNEITEVPPSPLTGSSVPPASYDGMKFFEDKDYDPFHVVQHDDFESRSHAAMIWKAPAVKPVVSVAAPAAQPDIRRPAQAIPATEEQPATPKVEDGIPASVRSILDKALENKTSEVTKLEKKISDFDARYKKAKGIGEKTAIEERIKKLDGELKEIKASSLVDFVPEGTDKSELEKWLPRYEKEIKQK